MPNAALHIFPLNANRVFSEDEAWEARMIPRGHGRSQASVQVRPGKALRGRKRTSKEPERREEEAVNTQQW